MILTSRRSQTWPRCTRDPPHVGIQHSEELACSCTHRHQQPTLSWPCPLHDGNCVPATRRSTHSENAKRSSLHRSPYLPCLLSCGNLSTKMSQFLAAKPYVMAVVISAIIVCKLSFELLTSKQCPPTKESMRSAVSSGSEYTALLRGPPFGGSFEFARKVLQVKGSKTS